MNVKQLNFRRLNQVIIEMVKLARSLISFSVASSLSVQSSAVVVNQDTDLQLHAQSRKIYLHSDRLFHQNQLNKINLQNKKISRHGENNTREQHR